MYAYYRTISFFVLLVSTFALPHVGDEAMVVTKTVLVTVTHTIRETASPPQSISSTYIRPSDPSIQCPDPKKPCIIDDIAKWPSGTSELGVSIPTLKRPPASISSSTLSSATMVSQEPWSSRPPPGHSGPSLLIDLASTTCSHTMSHIFPSNDPPTPEPKVNKTENDTKTSEEKDYYALPIDLPPAVSANTNEAQEEDDPIVHTYDRRDTTYRRRETPLWTRFFAFASPAPPQIVRDEDLDYGDEEMENVYATMGKNCIACEKGRSLICINGTHFGYCDEGCVEPRMLREGTKCVDGRIFGVDG